MVSSKTFKPILDYAWQITALLFALGIITSIFAPQFTTTINTLLGGLVWLFFLMKSVDAKISPKEAQALLITGILLGIVGAGGFGITVWPEIQGFFGLGPILKAIINTLSALALGVGAGLVTMAIIGIAHHQL